MILKCQCNHISQDLLHGQGNRVMNPTKDPTRVRCTSCKAIVNVNVTKSNIATVYVTNNTNKKRGK